jgi:hypothetical protein
MTSLIQKIIWNSSYWIISTSQGIYYLSESQAAPPTLATSNSIVGLSLASRRLVPYIASNITSTQTSSSSSTFISSFMITSQTSNTVNGDSTRSYNYPWSGLTSNSLVIGSCQSYTTILSQSGLPLYCISPSTNYIGFRMANTPTSNCSTFMTVNVLKM